MLALEVRQAPHLDEVVPSSRDDEWGSQGRREANTADPVGVGVTLHREHALTLDVPHLEHVVSATGHNLAIVGGERDGKNILGVTQELLDALAALQVPQTKRAVPRRRHNVLAVVRQGHVGDEA